MFMEITDSNMLNVFLQFKISLITIFSESTQNIILIYHMYGIFNYVFVFV